MDGSRLAGLFGPVCKCRESSKGWLAMAALRPYGPVPYGNYPAYGRTFACNRIRSRPGKPNQRKGKNEKFMNFAHFCEFWCFSLGKQARFTLNFCSGMPLRKVHELTFLWFGLPGPLLTEDWRLILRARFKGQT